MFLSLVDLVLANILSRPNAQKKVTDGWCVTSSFAQLARQISLSYQNYSSMCQVVLSLISFDGPFVLHKEIPTSLI